MENKQYRNMIEVKEDAEKNVVEMDIPSFSPEETAKRDQYRDLMVRSATSLSNDLNRFAVDNPGINEPSVWKLIENIDDFLGFLRNRY